MNGADYIAYLVTPGIRVRPIGRFRDAMSALDAAKRRAKEGEAISVNRRDVPQPAIRASELLAGIGGPMTREESLKRLNAQRTAELAYARWVRKQRRKP